MDISLIKNHLQTTWVGHEIFYQSVVHSTNKLLKQSIFKYKRGDVYLADEQTEGRGRFDRGWESIKGKDIILSLIDEFKISPHFTLTSLMVGVSVIKSLKNLYPQLNFSLKWPNDIMLIGKKLGGILIEIEKDKIIIGIGLNINHDTHLMPKFLREKSISLKDCLDREVSRELIIAKILNQYEKKCQELANQSPLEIINQWKKYSDTIGQKVTINLPNEKFTGICKDINDKGHILVEINEEIKEFSLGDVIYS